jgi:hypothetical protein
MLIPRPTRPRVSSCPNNGFDRMIEREMNRIIEIYRMAMFLPKYEDAFVAP